MKISFWKDEGCSKQKHQKQVLSWKDRLASCHSCCFFVYGAGSGSDTPKVDQQSDHPSKSPQPLVPRKLPRVFSQVHIPKFKNL